MTFLVASKSFSISGRTGKIGVSVFYNSFINMFTGVTIYSFVHPWIFIFDLKLSLRVVCLKSLANKVFLHQLRAKY